MKRNTLAILSKCFHTTYRENAFSSSGVAEPAMNGWKVSRNPLNVRKKFADCIGVLPVMSVNKGSSYRGDTAKRRLRQDDARIILVHTPVHANWLNQVEIYFSIIQWKVLTPNDFADLDAIRLRLVWYEELSSQRPTPFQWKFDRAKLRALLAKIEIH
jgi:hypothetical protein